jgi:hypothetical protein
MASLLQRFRWVLGLFILGLVLAGLTAFPLLTEMQLLSSWLGIDDPARYADYTGLRHWLAWVHYGLRETDARFPFIAYGTDWLAFGHLTIAMFFIGPWRAPVANAWVLRVGLVACAAVVVLAMVCGEVRGIPFYWRLIDSSFGVFGALPLWYCLRLVQRMEALLPGQPAQ